MDQLPHPAPHLPIPGNIVHYRLTDAQANEINRRRTTGMSIGERIKVLMWPLGAQAHIGNEAHGGDYFPAIVIKRWSDGPDALIQLQVFLDGNDVLWATSVHQGTANGTWTWPPPT